MSHRHPLHRRIAMSSALNHRYPTVQGEFEDESELEFEAEDELELEDESEFEDEFEDEAFLGAIRGIAGAVGNLLGEGETEDEDENEDESEAFVNPVQRIYRDAELMAHLSRQAADAEGEEESEAFIGALIPIAARLIPRAASLVARNAPALIRGATKIVRKLRRDPTTRRLIRAMPVVLQRTAQSLADQAMAGRPITAGTAVNTLVRMTGRVLGSPAGRQSAVRAVDIFDDRFRRRARRRPAPGMAGGPAYSRASSPARR